MKSILSACVVVVAFAANASAIEIIVTPVIKIDYTVSGGPVETGFQALTAPAAPSIFGPITIENFNHTGNFNRNSLVDAGAFTFADLYNDFIHNNGADFQVKISGLNVSDTYQLRLYVYDNDTTPAKVVTNTFSPILGTTGVPGVVVYTHGVPPLTNNQYSTLVDWISNPSGEIDFNVSANAERRLSGFELVQVQIVPEPSTLVLLGLGAIGLVVRARRRRTAV